MSSQAQDRLYFLDIAISTIPNINGRILTCRPDGTDLKEVVTNLKSFPDGIAIDLPNNHIYWTNMGVPSQPHDGSIQRCDLSGQNIVTIVRPGITHTPKQLTLARKSRKLYWCDREGMRVMRCNLDGSDVEILHQAGATDEDSKDCRKWCVGIAVDEDAGYIYWTQKGFSKGNAGRIFRMPVHMKEGETATSRSDIELLLDNLPEPIDLEIDEEEKILYWTDRGDPPFGNSVNCASVLHRTENGRLERKILVRKLHEGIGLALDKTNRRLFFSDLCGGLYSCNLDGSEKRTLNADIGEGTGVAYA